MIATFLNYMFGYNKQTDICNNTNTNTNNIDKLCKKLPYELKDYILRYDGRIKYKYKIKNSIDYHKFVNVIHKHDGRYDIITPIIHKKYTILEDIMTSPVDTSFYFEFAFENQPNLMLCYDYNWSYNNMFEICYTDMKGSGHILGSDQIRTYI
tara:strand:+ start:209 stop:667 length:459 start_codon:yes stop_codon:yes gene_type:complete